MSIHDWTIHEWWQHIQNWNCCLVYDGPRYLMLYWLTTQP